jgi:hypothetical protein
VGPHPSTPAATTTALHLDGQAIYPRGGSGRSTTICDRRRLALLLLAEGGGVYGFDNQPEVIPSCPADLRTFLKLLLTSSASPSWLLRGDSHAGIEPNAGSLQCTRIYRVAERGEIYIDSPLRPSPPLNNPSRGLAPF